MYPAWTIVIRSVWKSVGFRCNMYRLSWLAHSGAIKGPPLLLLAAAAVFEKRVRLCPLRPQEGITPIEAFVGQPPDVKTKLVDNAGISVSPSLLFILSRSLHRIPQVLFKRMKIHFS